MADPSPTTDKAATTNVEDIEDVKERYSETPKHVEGNAFLISPDGTVRKLPVPSSDPNDPLNFSRWRKFGIVVACCWFSTMSLTLVGGLGSILGVFFGMYAPQGKTTNQIVWLSTMPSLFVGVGNYIILPFALLFGRRPAFLLAIIVTLGSTIGAALSNSYEGHLVARIIQGLATGSTESLLPLIISDITFLHERSFYFGCYWTSQNVITAVLNIASSYEVAALGWRWYYGILTIAIGIGLLLAFFFSFETRYQRAPTSIDGQVVFTDAFGVTHILSDEEGRERLAGIPEADTTIDAQVPMKSYLELIKPFESMTHDGPRLAIVSYVDMAKAFISPGILFAVMLAAISLGVPIAISLTYDTVLQKSYGWPANSVGLINVQLGSIPAAACAMFYAGWMGDKISLWLANRNNGVHLPEHRLIILLPGFVVGIIGLMVYAAGAQWPERYSWAAPVLGWSLFQFTFIVVIIVTTTFAAEVLPKNPGPALVVVVGTKNIVAFAASYGLVPMVQKYNYITAFSVLAGIFCAICSLGIPVYFFGPKWRAYISRRSS
ncbi:major facilitator superfamily domain-containing protein [Tricladium varicosporioides]|nr:major facilitator superfamily domain-containing protein [Hymenoscyphus varicosporioides]